MTQQRMLRPSPMLMGCRVTQYAMRDRSVTFRGRTNLYVDGKQLRAVPRLAIGEGRTGECVLLHCGRTWKVRGAESYATLAGDVAITGSVYAQPSRLGATNTACAFCTENLSIRLLPDWTDRSEATSGSLSRGRRHWLCKGIVAARWHVWPGKPPPHTPSAALLRSELPSGPSPPSEVVAYECEREPQQRQGDRQAVFLQGQRVQRDSREDSRLGDYPPPKSRNRHLVPLARYIGSWPSCLLLASYTCSNRRHIKRPGVDPERSVAYFKKKPIPRASSQKAAENSIERRSRRDQLGAKH
jgi:hypothetical protein